MKFFVGNLDLQATKEDLAGIFSTFGTVATAMIAKNAATGEGHGYGFVEMLDEIEATSALEHLDGFRLMDRPLRVLQRLEAK
jgi:RNA recognition motif-containing protein